MFSETEQEADKTDAFSTFVSEKETGGLKWNKKTRPERQKKATDFIMLSEYILHVCFIANLSASIAASHLRPQSSQHVVLLSLLTGSINQGFSDDSESKRYKLTEIPM